MANITNMENNISRIYTANVKLNETDKDYRKMLIVENDKGVLFIENDLCVISFMPGQSVDVIVKNKYNLVNIEL